MEFRGDRLATFRKAQGKTQAQLADDLGISQNQISKYERENHFPTAETLLKMARMFDTSIDYLMGLTNKPTPDAEPEPHLNEHEAALLEMMRARSKKDQARLVQIVRLMWEE